MCGCYISFIYIIFWILVCDFILGSYMKILIFNLILENGISGKFYIVGKI